MKILDVILPKTYFLIKRSPILKRILKTLWISFHQIKSYQPFTRKYPDPLKLPVECVEESFSWFQKITLNQTPLKNLSLKAIHEKQSITRIVPKTLDNRLYWKFDNCTPRPIRQNLVMSIPKARVLLDGFVLGFDQTLLSDFSIVPDIPNDKHPLKQITKISPLKHLQGKAAVLSVFGGNGYYHWMFEVLPRLELIRQAGWNWEEIDYFIVNALMAPFQRESLELLGIPHSKIIESQWHRHLSADLLIVPSIPEYVSPWVCDFLKKSFFKNPPNQASKRLYISRKYSSHRKVKNEEETYALLKEYHFERIFFENYSLSEQARLMNSAEIVIAPHGAGLSNLVFCKEGTKVVELIYPKSVKRLFWSLSSILKLDYYYLFAKGELPPEGEDAYLNSEAMEIDLNALQRILKQIMP